MITTLRPGLFQREIKVEHNDHVAPVNNFASDQLKAVNVDLPGFDGESLVVE